DRDGAGAGRTDHVGAAAAAPRGSAALSQSSRPRVLRVRTRFSRGDPRFGRQQGASGARRIRRHLLQAVAIARRRGGARGRGGDACIVRCRRNCGAAKRAGVWLQRFQDPAGPPDAARRAHSSCQPQLRRSHMAQNDLASPIGGPLDRVDGPLKVTGRAKYAFEYAAQGEAAYGFIVSAAIGKGRVASVDVRDAERAPGVLLVLTQDNAPPQTPWGPVDLPDRFARAEPALDTDAVRYFGFPVAFVVAETFEQARAAAALVRVRYTPAPGDYDLHAAAPRAENPGHIGDGGPADSGTGDFQSRFAAAPVKIDAAYRTPYQHSAPMEPHASMAFWEGEMLTVCTAAQLTTSPREGLARTLNIPPENVRIITRYIGGG